MSSMSQCLWGEVSFFFLFNYRLYFFKAIGLFKSSISSDVAFSKLYFSSNFSILLVQLTLEQCEGSGYCTLNLKITYDF